MVDENVFSRYATVDVDTSTGTKQLTFLLIKKLKNALFV